MDEFEGCSAGSAEGLIALGYPVVHDAGQLVLTTGAGILVVSRHHPGRRGHISVATDRLQSETVLHNGLPFRPMWPWALALFAGFPVDHQVSDFVGDGVFQEIGEILRQQLLVNAQTGVTVAINSGLTGTTAA